jgi:predicted ATP-binding protein involved in virulence
MYIFKDAENKTIAEGQDGASIKFHNRLIINPIGFYKEGEEVIIFTKEEFEKLENYRSNKEEEIFKLAKECIKNTEKSNEIIESYHSKIEELEKENENLKRINIKLSEKNGG